MRLLSSLAPLLVAALLPLSAEDDAADRHLSGTARVVVADECALASFRQMLCGAHPGAEVSAFLVEEDDGLALLIWPRMAWLSKQNFQGAIPPRTIAIVHTHPRYQDKPSSDDVREAKRLLLPIFVITLTSISIVEPEREPPVTVVARGIWSERAPARLPSGCRKPRIARVAEAR